MNGLTVRLLDMAVDNILDKFRIDDDLVLAREDLKRLFL
jgi:hypothetical protein